MGDRIIISCKSSFLMLLNQLVPGFHIQLVVIPGERSCEYLSRDLDPLGDDLGCLGVVWWPVELPPSHTRVAINSIQFNLAPSWMELTTVNGSPSSIDQYTNPVDGIELKLKAVEAIRSYACPPPLPRPHRHPFAALMRHDHPYTELHSPVGCCQS